MSAFETDYLIIGAGAMGLAFADALVTSNPSATLYIVDSKDRPGGHWVHSYPFVKLHQPALTYGVNSLELSRGTIDTHGPNKGLEALATGMEVLGYFARAMDNLLATGRVKYLPLHMWKDGVAINMVTGAKVAVRAKKEVDAGYYTTVVSKMRAPPWTVGPGTTCIPSASLPDHASKCPPHYCIVGNGKTGIDAIVWLIERGTDPGQITWIVPRDSYMYNRAIGQVAQLKMSSLPFHLEAAKAVAEAEDVDEMWARLVESGYVRVLDPAHKPSTWHCPVVSDVEFECIRKVKDVVRLGHVKSIADDEMVLEKGSKKLPAGTIVVDCAAATLKGRPVVPVFQGNRIVLQPLFACQQVFSAVLLAHIEATYPTDDAKNALAKPVPHPDVPIDFVSNRLASNVNFISWYKDPKLVQWLAKCRLFAPSVYFPEIPDEQTAAALGEGLAAMLEVENAKLRQLLSKASKV